MSHSSSRSRRSAAQKSSDDSGYVSADGEFYCSIEAHLASKDRYRVVGHGIIRPYPLHGATCSQQMANVVSSYVETRAAAILARHGIEGTSSLSTRWRPLEEIVHTYLIRTDSTDTTNWRNAAIEINLLFLNAGVAQGDIEVEITNLSLSIQQISTTLPNDPVLLAALEGTRSSIVNFLQSHAPHWTSIAYHMRHHRLRPNEPKRPTILLFFRIGSVSKYEALEAQLADSLKPAAIPLHFEFLSGEIDLCVQEPPQRPQIPRTPFSFNPRNGDSIGRRGDDLGAGTLGGWVMLKYSNNKRVKCAMTCFHVVAGPTIPDPPVLGTKAIDATTSSSKIEMEFPASYDRKHAIQLYKGHLQSGLNPQDRVIYQKELDRLEQREKSPVIGTVILSSGVRPNEANRWMDWALIETPSTYNINVPPSAASFIPADSRWTNNGAVETLYRTDATSRIRAMGNIEVGDWVVKRGRTSFDTSGEVNKLWRSIKWEGYNNFITEEIEVEGLNGDFARPGDSGAFVTNANHELVGMVIGRDANVSKYDFGIITGIRDIEQDVKALCGATLVVPS